jgi:hypothetical protein
MQAFRFLVPLLAMAGLAASLAGVAIAADESGARAFLLQDALKRQGLRPARPATGDLVSNLSSSSALPTGQQRTYCVRTCDGYYFAIGFARNKGQLAEHQAMCAASCGGLPMKLFTASVQHDDDAGRTGPAIERAIDSTGALYTALSTAYAFKTADTSSCACKTTLNGLPQIPISIDPTLRDGDIIVTQDGLKVFRGQTPGPHNEEDFISVASAKSLPTIVRQQMLSLQNRIAE